MNVVQHSAAREDHVSPEAVVERARSLMGSIEYDPASSPTANKIIKADRFDTEGALERRWLAKTVWLNPPGGALRLVEGKWHEADEEIEGRGRAHSKAALYWSKLVASWQSGDVEQAVFLGFTLEILRTSQLYGLPPVSSFPHVIPPGRIRFLHPETLKPQTQPGHGNVIAWLPPDRENDRAFQDRMFRSYFADVGAVCCPLW
jgi:hypothetical protein